jgi:hypothetical protein
VRPTRNAGVFSSRPDHDRPDARRAPGPRDIGFALKKSNRIKRNRDEDPFPSIARHISEQLRLSGWRFEHANTGAVLKPTPAVSLEELPRAEQGNALALRMIREALEEHCPPGTLPAEDHVVLEAVAAGTSAGAGVDRAIAAEAEVLVKAILTLAASR